MTRSATLMLIAGFGFAAALLAYTIRGYLTHARRRR